MNKFFTLFALGITLYASAQKKVLTHEDYDKWESISSYDLSANGKYVRYEINPQEGDGNLYVYDANNDETKKFTRGYGAKFTHNNNYLVFKVKPEYAETREAKRKEKKKDEMPRNHVVVVDLNTWVMDTINEASSFKISEEYEGWVAIKLENKRKEKKDKSKDEKNSKEEESAEEKKSEKEKSSKEKDEKKSKKKIVKNRILLWELGGSKRDTIGWVNEYSFAKKSPRLLYSIKNEKADSIKGVFYYENGQSELLDTNGKSFVKLAISEQGDKMVWSSTQDSADAEVKTFTLNIFSNNKVNKIEPGYPGLPEGRMVSEFYAPRFSETGDYLFIESRPIPKEVEKDTMELKEEKVSLDIWSWTDTIIQPDQNKNLNQTKENGQKAILHMNDMKLVTLEENYYDNVSYSLKNVTDWLAISNNAKSYRSLSWNYPIAEDLSVININTGERKLIAQDIKGYGGVSTGGKYYYLYDKEKKQWLATEISSAKQIVLNQFKDPVWNVENDIPALPGSYGLAGWSEEDKSVFIYTQFSVWRVDLDQPENPVLLTPQDKDNPIRYRRHRLDDEKLFIGTLLTLNAFEEKSKKEGFAVVNSDGNDFKMVHEFEDVHYTGSANAKRGPGKLLRKGTFVNYPEIYYLDKWTGTPKKISETNPQQKEYNWGTIELVSWKGKKGVGNLDGLLIKPENFDPNKKYPVLIYFYERYSDLKNYYFGFKPSASTINFAYFASNEYVVFIPDIVYKTGYPGQSAYNCVVSGAEWLAKQSFVDASRMAIQGQSWGGYQVAYLVTQTDMFACGMAGAPVSNMTSAYGGIRWGSGWSREFQYEKTQSRLGATLWENRKVYIENSPVFYADKVNTPLLMMHNDDDGAVPWYQGIEYFMALRRLNKPTWMLVYNKEAHNLRKRHNRKDLSIRMAQFFDHYLKGAEMPEWMRDGRKAIDKKTNKAY